MSTPIIDRTAAARWMQHLDQLEATLGEAVVSFHAAGVQPMQQPVIVRICDQYAHAIEQAHAVLAELPIAWADEQILAVNAHAKRLKALGYSF